MKKIIITLSICLAFVLSSNAQNQLTFNQVLLVTLTSQGDTVPQGKVWKIESAVSTIGTLSSNVSFGLSYFRVNGISVDVAKIQLLQYYANGPNAFNSSISSNTTFPMWLPEGSIVTSGARVSALSIIEFNIQ
jgi:hypothetical protein